MDLCKFEKDALYREAEKDIKSRFPNYYLAYRNIIRYDSGSRVAEISWRIEGYDAEDGKKQKIYRYKLSEDSLKWFYVDSDN